MIDSIRLWQRRYFTSYFLSKIFKFNCSFDNIRVKDLKTEYGFDFGDLVTCDNNSLLLGRRFYLFGYNESRELVLLPENCHFKFSFDPKKYCFRLWTPKDEMYKLFRGYSQILKNVISSVKGWRFYE